MDSTDYTERIIPERRTTDEIGGEAKTKSLRGDLSKVDDGH